MAKKRNPNKVIKETNEFITESISTISDFFN